MRSVMHWLAGILWMAMVVPALAQPGTSARVDKVFSAWDKLDSPGVALVVLRDGKPVHGRGYGMANLEYSVPNTVTTVFHVASLSKQFTAFAIQLLVRDGKLSLDDELRRHLPELQLNGPPITIRHLIHHTSGLRDQWSLLMLAGLRLDDVITQDDILGLLGRQKQLNFNPGDEELYSNSGYTLLAQIVKRVTGQSMAVFAKERIFAPLGMTSTHLQEHYGTLVPGRAYSYQRVQGGWQQVALSYSNVGATSVFTTAQDMVLWARNFDTPEVGGAAVQAAMLVRGKLNSGREIDYASGLATGRYRGLPWVGHAGVDAGFRAHMLRFAQAGLTILLLGNAADLNSAALAREVADIYLEGAPGFEPPKPFPAEVQMQAHELAPFLGDFEMRPGFIVSFTAERNQLMVQATGQPRFAMFAMGDQRFFTKAFEASVTFAAPVANTPVPSAVWHQGGRNNPLQRVTRDAPDSAALQRCVGDYYSDELGALYRLQLRDGKLMVRYPRGERELKPVTRDIFEAGFPLGKVGLLRNAAGVCDGLSITTGRVRNLRFDRVSLKPAVP